MEEECEQDGDCALFLSFRCFLQRQLLPQRPMQFQLLLHGTRSVYAIARGLLYAPDLNPGPNASRAPPPAPPAMPTAPPQAQPESTRSFELTIATGARAGLERAANGRRDGGCFCVLPPARSPSRVRRDPEAGLRADATRPAGLNRSRRFAPGFFLYWTLHAAFCYAACTRRRALRSQHLKSPACATRSASQSSCSRRAAACRSARTSSAPPEPARAATYEDWEQSAIRCVLLLHARGGRLRLQRLQL